MYCSWCLSWYKQYRKANMLIFVVRRRADRHVCVYRYTYTQEKKTLHEVVLLLCIFTIHVCIQCMGFLFCVYISEMYVLQVTIRRLWFRRMNFNVLLFSWIKKRLSREKVKTLHSFQLVGRLSPLWTVHLFTFCPYTLRMYRCIFLSFYFTCTDSEIRMNEFDRLMKIIIFGFF